MALEQKHRIRGARNVQRILREGKAVRGSFFFLKVSPNTEGTARFGFLVPGRVVQKAAERNRIRRMLSESVRPFLERKTPGFDVVVGVVKDFSGDTSELQALLSELFKKSKIF